MAAKSKFTVQEMRKRAMHRLAGIFFDHWEEGRVGHTRLFETLIPDEFVVLGVSGEGARYREHVVPCAYLRDKCMEMYQGGASITEVADALDRHLHIVLITAEQAHTLNNVHGWKTRMPDAWVFNRDDPLARLTKAGISWECFSQRSLSP